ncbi:MAG: competence lipoprotein ComL, putative [uncultured Sphingomonadaceae bacterium]|uniref:Outer membrane protein assembly factor BamD n=1 Tax=uncultured Sphingomonadaceae bacterium TaxID=169976 RepID=A0A6J4TUG6_9SPHN|nr:MAG: competence lipoprotein ComL, putative [uncultured Sphingomonadaceae bacterium]
MQNRSFHASILAALAASVALTACAGGTKTRADTNYIARDVGTLYTLGKNRLNAGRYEEAAVVFDEVERQHPYSDWARRAQLMSSFSYYMAKKHTESVQSATRFLSIHPGNKDAPYALYLVGMNYYDQITDVTRDQGITQQALDSLGELIRRYPQSRYAADARLKVDLVQDHLAGKEMEIGRFYQRSSNWLASVMRFRAVVDQYQTTTHAPEALMRLTESYLALGVPEEAQKTAAVLGANYPGSKWYERAYALVREKTPAPKAASAS